MPELPEVETIRRGLKDFILGQKIKKIDVLNEKSFVGKPVLGKVMNIRRFGKALVIDLDNGYSLMMHLRMTGQLVWQGENRDARFAGGHPSENFVSKLPNKQTRVVLDFDKGTLFFNDQRKFGFVKVLLTVELKEEAFIRKLAKEPWEMGARELYKKLQRHKQSAIKAVILDQSVLSGLGNIYADEALFRAKIHPKRKAGSLSLDEVTKLLAAACGVMEDSLEAGGSTLQNYVQADGSRGNYLDLFAKVYHRDGEPCVVCGTKIAKIKVGGRGTHFCPECQKLEIDDSETDKKRKQKSRSKK